MENHKIRVAITQGDTNGIGYELILKTFGEPEMQEICTPIIYGSQKIAAYHSNALQQQSHFHIIKDAREARDGKVNLIVCCNEETKVDFGRETAESKAAAQSAMDKALADAKDGCFDVLVCCPANNGKKGEHIYINDVVRVATLCEGDAKAEGALTQENLTEKVKMIHSMLKRDFRLSNPRIAILALNSEPTIEEQEIIAPAVSALAESSIQVFGPYQAEDFIGTRKYEAFDAILAMNRKQAEPFGKLTDTEGVAVLSGMPVVSTMPDTDAHYDIAGKNEANEAIFRNAIYTAIDIFRNQKEYDRPLVNPLPKLYHERPDNGEKLRFSIPKKKEEA